MINISSKIQIKPTIHSQKNERALNAEDIEVLEREKKKNADRETDQLLEPK